MIRYLLVIGLFCGLWMSCIPLSTESLTILSGSENNSLEPLIKEFGKKNRIDITIHYRGSVDIMLELGKEEISYDAIWPANSMWLSLGDKNRTIQHAKSIMTSPVVFGVKHSLVKKFDLIEKEVRVRDILERITLPSKTA